MKKLLATLACVPVLGFSTVGATGYNHNDNHEHKPKVCTLEDSMYKKKHCKKEEPKPCEFNPQLHVGDEECKPPVESVPDVPSQPEQPKTEDQPKQEEKPQPVVPASASVSAEVSFGK